MFSRWAEIFAEVAISGSITPTQPATKALCEEIADFGLLERAGGSYVRTDKTAPFCNGQPLPGGARFS